MDDFIAQPRPPARAAAWRAAALLLALGVGACCAPGGKGFTSLWLSSCGAPRDTFGHRLDGAPDPPPYPEQ